MGLIMTKITSRNVAFGAVIISVSLLSASVGALLVGSSINQYSSSLNEKGADIFPVNLVRPPVVPGTEKEALLKVKERTDKSSLAIVNMADPVHKSGVIVSRTIGTATALTTDGWILLPNNIVAEFGRNAKIVFDGEVYNIDKFVPDSETGYGFAKTKISSSRVGVFGSSDNVTSGDLAFVVSGTAIYPRTIVSGEYYPSETMLFSSDALTRLFSLDQAVDTEPGAMVTNAVGEIIGFMADSKTVRPLHHVTSVLENVLLSDDLSRSSIGLQYVDIVRVADPAEDFREGFRVVKIERGSTAEKSGLEVGDVILRIQGQSVDVKPLSEYVATGKAGDKIQLNINRSATEMEIFVTLE